MPLSEDEQRILTEIEQHLYASDPGLARQVGSTTVYSEALRGVRWGLVGVVLGLVLTVALLNVNFGLSFLLGFGPMLLSAWFLQRNLRRLGKTGLDQATKSFRSNALREYLGNASERARERFKRDEPDS